MPDGEDAEVNIPSIPYFYHDIVARIIPGTIQIGLIVALAGQQSGGWTADMKTALKDFQFAAALIFAGFAYFIGVVYEGLMALPMGSSGSFSSLYHCAFKCALKRRSESGGLQLQVSDTKGTASLAEAMSSILESYEPIVPHFFARATRFLAEAKMALYAALAMPTSFVVVGITTGKWLPPSTYIAIAGFALLFLLLTAVSYARQVRRAVEILRCIEYLSLRTEQNDAQKRASAVWNRAFKAQPAEPSASADARESKKQAQ